jgi:hypothetical protein
VRAAVVVLEELARSRGQVWFETGAVADALGCSVSEAAAQLRSAARAGLCVSRKSLVYGTSWKAVDVGSARKVAEQGAQVAGRAQ